MKKALCLFLTLLTLSGCCPAFADDTADGKASTINIIDGATQKTRNTVFDLASSNPIAVGVVDGSGNQLTSFGGGTQYAEGATASTITGTVAMAAGTPTTIVALQADSNKNLKVIQATGSSVKILDANGNAYPATIPVSSATGTTTKIADTNGNVYPATIPVANTPATGATVKIADKNGNVYGPTLAMSIASGQVASGAFASGSIASGALASGSVAAGAIATGNSIAINNSPNVIVGTHPVTMVSGAVASGAYASGALASGSIAAGAIATGNSIAINNAPDVRLIAGTAEIGNVKNSGTFTTQDTPATGATMKVAGLNGNVFSGVITGGYSAMSVFPATASTMAVTNAGTFATQDTPATGATMKIAGLNGNVTSSVITGGYNALSVFPATASTMAVTNAGTFATQDTPATGASVKILDASGNAFSSWDVSTQATLSTVGQKIKTTAGSFGGYTFYNPNSSVAFIQVHDVGSSAVTTSTIKMIMGIPATAGANIEISSGLKFSTGIYVTASATAGTITAPTLPINGSVFYK